MPIKIHYGPPGSFKTSGALGDDFLREAKAGRVVVTNVRGLTRDRVIDQFPDLPETFDVIHVDDKTEEGRDKLAKWFHWVPKGAFIFLDEVQDIWPKRWRDADIKALDYPGGLSAATKADRPFCWDQAFDKHRHWNWDMVLTTPSYKKVRDDVKGVADMAYKHKDLALVGWMGRYMEAAHLADDSGASQSDFLNVVQKKVPAYVFKLYDSTTTGQFSVTRSGFNLFASPRILILLAVLCGALYIGFGRRDVTLFSGAAKTATSPKPAVPSASETPGAPPASMGGDGVSVRPADKGDVVAPFSGDDVFISSSMRINGVWKYMVSFANTDFTNEQILDLGFSISSAGSCGVKLAKNGWERLVTCGRSKPFELVKESHPAPVQQPQQVAANPLSVLPNDPVQVTPPPSTQAAPAPQYRPLKG